jgi:arylsulfatase A-like enzyme
MADRPNVVVIMADQFHPEALGCGDRPVETPNVDRLANQGVRFESTYCPSPICGPARASIFSGRYPQETGITSNWEPVPNDLPLLPEVLRDSGYHTALVGKLHLSPHAAPHGFEYRQRHDSMYDLYYAEEPWQSAYVEWLAEERFDGDVTAVIDRANADESYFSEDRTSVRKFLLGSNWREESEHSNAWVGRGSVRYLEDHREEPFFLFASYFGPHQPMAAPGRWADRYDPDDIELPPEFDVETGDKPILRNDDPGVPQSGDTWRREEYQEVLAAYYGQVSMIDYYTGQILDALDRLGLAEDTLVVFTADHGDHAAQFGKFTKGSMYHGSVGVPLVVRDPTRTDHAGTTTQRVLNTVDLHDTILEYCGVDHGEETASRSFLPLLEDPETDDWTDRTYSEFGDSAMVVDGEYKLYRGRDGDFELYDRHDRPRDGENLWEHGEYGDVQDRLFDRLETFENDLMAGNRLWDSP